MSKKKVFLSTFGALAAAGAVVAGVMAKKRGKVKVEGSLEARGGKNPMGSGTNRTVRGSASVNTTKTPNRQP